MKILAIMLPLFFAAVASGEIYTWRDSRGSDHYTNSLYEIPARYLPRAMQLDVATGRKTKLVSPQPQPAGQPAAGGSPAPGTVVGVPATPAREALRTRKRPHRHEEDE